MIYILLPLVAASSDGSMAALSNDLELEIEVSPVKDSASESNHREPNQKDPPQEEVTRTRPRLVGDQYNYYGSPPAGYQQQQRVPYYQQSINGPETYPPYYQGPYPYPYYPNYVRPPFVPTTTTTTTTAAPPRPIGYILMDTYHSPRGSISRPIAFFTT